MICVNEKRDRKFNNGTKKTTKFDTHFHFHTKNEKKKNNILMDKTKRKGWYWNHAMLAAYYAN